MPIIKLKSFLSKNSDSILAVKKFVCIVSLLVNIWLYLPNIIVTFIPSGIFISNFNLYLPGPLKYLSKLKIKLALIKYK